MQDWLGYKSIYSLRWVIRLSFMFIDFQKVIVADKSFSMFLCKATRFNWITYCVFRLCNRAWSILRKIAHFANIFVNDLQITNH